MKNFLLFILLITLFVIGAGFFYAAPKAEKEIMAQLHNLGFQNAVIEGSSFKFSSIEIEKISLDKDAFSSLKKISIAVFWPKFLIKKDIENIKIDTVHLAITKEELATLIRTSKQKDFFTLTQIKTQEINFKNIILDIAGDQNAIRIEGKSTIEKVDNQHKIKAKIYAAQHEMSFNSDWVGRINEKNNIELEGSIDQLNINYPPFHLHRGTGWLSYAQQGEDITLSSQLDSGSGKIFDVPINNISLTIGKKDDYYPILFRANASGINGVTFTSDAHYTQEAKKQVFKTTLSIDNFSSFFNYLKKLGLIKENFINDNNNPKEISLTYMPEKRFADGPVPFDFKIEEKNTNLVNGTFLVYTDSLDIRGTAQAQQDALSIIKKLFPIKDENITDDTIRIDGNLKSLIHTNR